MAKANHNTRRDHKRAERARRHKSTAGVRQATLAATALRSSVSAGQLEQVAEVLADPERRAEYAKLGARFGISPEQFEQAASSLTASHDTPDDSEDAQDPGGSAP